MTGPPGRSRVRWRSFKRYRRRGREYKPVTNHPGDEAQRRLDMYAEKGIMIIEPQTVNIALFQKAEIYSARHELRRPLDVLETTREAT